MLRRSVIKGLVRVTAAVLIMRIGACPDEFNGPVAGFHVDGKKGYGNIPQKPVMIGFHRILIALAAKYIGVDIFVAHYENGYGCPGFVKSV
jgi:hypothetical protein